MADDWREGKAQKITLTVDSRGVGFEREEADGRTEWVRRQMPEGPGSMLPFPGAERLTPAELLEALRGPVGA
jgi:hypothetical protein